MTSMTARRAVCAIAMTAAFLVLVACGSSPGQEARSNVDTFQRDQRPERLVEIGKAFAKMGDLTRAEQYFAAALDAGADGRVVVPMLVTVCIRDGRYRAALEYGEAHLTKHPSDARTRFVVATVYAGLGEAEPARKHLEKVLGERPTEAEAHFALAVLMRESLRDPVGADQHFREYLRLSPKGAHAEEAEASLLKSVPQ